MFLYKQPVAVRGKVKFEMEFWELQEDMADQLHIPCLEATPPPQKKKFDLTFPSSELSWTTRLCQSYKGRRQRKGRGVKAIEENFTCVRREMEEWLWEF